MQELDNRKSLILELGLNPAAYLPLRKYLELLWDANSDLNLVSRQMTLESLVDNHVIDCLLALSQFPKNAQSIADFGSGGGLPGVIYAIQFPEKPYILFEKSPKKQSFLRQCQSIAPNIEVRGEILSDIPDVDLVTSRAFKPIDVILEISRHYYQRGGRYFLLKGRREKIEEEIRLARRKIKGLDVTIKPLQSPLLEVERHLVLI